MFFFLLSLSLTVLPHCFSPLCMLPTASVYLPLTFHMPDERVSFLIPEMSTVSFWLYTLFAHFPKKRSSRLLECSVHSQIPPVEPHLSCITSPPYLWENCPTLNDLWGSVHFSLSVLWFSCLLMFVYLSVGIFCYYSPPIDFCVTFPTIFFKKNYQIGSYFILTSPVRNSLFGFFRFLDKLQWVNITKYEDFCSVYACMCIVMCLLWQTCVCKVALIYIAAAIECDLIDRSSCSTSTYTNRLRLCEHLSLLLDKRLKNSKQKFKVDKTDRNK